MSRKGFFFVIIAFVLISYLLASTYAWVRAIEMEEARYSESFRTTSMEMLVDQITDAKISEMTHAMSTYAFYSLDNYSISHPVKDGGAAGDDAEFENIHYAVRDLMLEGAASGDYFEDGEPLSYQAEDELSTYTLYGWGGKLNDSLSSSGFEMEEFSIDENSFTFRQVDYLLFEVNFSLNMTIRDTREGSSTSISRIYQISNLVNASGMVDPYIARESVRDDQLGLDYPAEKQAFMAPYDEMYYYEDYEDDYPDVLPSEDTDLNDVYESLCHSGDSEPCYYMGSGSEGQGWAYGPAIAVEDAIDNPIPDDQAWKFILVGNYSDISNFDSHGNFSGYILTSEPEETASCGDHSDQSATFNALKWDDDGSGGCEVEIDPDTYTDKPFVVDGNFDIDDFIGPDEEHRVLFISRYSFAQVDEDPEIKLNANPSFYDIEMFRDFVVCGYYLPRQESPSFLQRMFELHSDMREGGIFGIETTAVGTWAGGNSSAYSDDWNPYSRVDAEFFSQTDGVKIKGLPGCKNAWMCDDDFITDLGQFKLGDDSRLRYNVPAEDGIDSDNIGCDNDDQATCEIDE